MLSAPVYGALRQFPFLEQPPMRVNCQLGRRSLSAVHPLTSEGPDASMPTHRVVGPIPATVVIPVSGHLYERQQTMRQWMKRSYRVLVLTAVMVLPLLLVAGPALAVSPFEGNPPGKQWGGKHNVQGRLIELGRDVFPSGAERVVYQVVTKDPRVRGVMVLWVTSAWPSEGGNVGFSGYWNLATESGGWHDDYFVGLESANYLVGRPFQLTVSGEALGSGENAGLVLHYSGHRASADPNHPSNSTLIIKGNVEEVD